MYMHIRPSLNTSTGCTKIKTHVLVFKNEHFNNKIVIDMKIVHIHSTSNIQPGRLPAISTYSYIIPAVITKSGGKPHHLIL